jgi:hypothetical protein
MRIGIGILVVSAFALAASIAGAQTGLAEID